MQHGAMPLAAPWSATGLGLAFAMWAVMMTAMMLPSAAPMLRAFAALDRPRSRVARATRLAAFAAGYVAVWLVFSVAATLLQATLHDAALLDGRFALTSPALGAALFLTIGLWQLTPIKQTCLARCRTPVAFLMTEWRERARGALTMGVRHGAFCVGCCWALMLALFAAGVMNLLWIALIAAWVLVEKALPFGRHAARAAGVASLAWGFWLLLSA